MALITPVVKDVSPQGDQSCIQVVWNNVTENDGCVAVSYPKHSDKSIQVAGTIGGSSVALHGSNDGSNYTPLRSPDSTILALAGPSMRAVLENTLYIRPLPTGGSGQSLIISMLLHLSNPQRQ